MASKYSKVYRAVEEFKNFLDFEVQNFINAYEYIKPGQGWLIKNFEHDIYDLINNLYGNLYDDLYPKLLQENPATDEEIIKQFKDILDYLTQSIILFEKIKEKSVENYLDSVEGIVFDLVYKTIYKLREVIRLAEDDLKNLEIVVSNVPVKIIGKDLIGIVTVTQIELQSVLDLMTETIIHSYDENDSNIYHEGFFKKNGKEVKVVITQTHHQGMSATSNTTTKLLLKYNPEYIFMVGHQAGNKNLKDSQSLGDILIGSESVDYQQIEVIEKRGNELLCVERDKKYSININPNLKSKLELFCKKDEVLDLIKKSYKGHSKFLNNLKAHLGKIVSGSALLRSSTRYDEIINQNPGLVGLDMETHGFYYSCQNSFLHQLPKFVSVKSISDFGEESNRYAKNVKSSSVRQKYACYTSAYFVKEFVLSNL